MWFIETDSNPFYWVENDVTCHFKVNQECGLIETSYIHANSITFQSLKKKTLRQRKLDISDVYVYYMKGETVIGSYPIIHKQKVPVPLIPYLKNKIMQFFEL